MEKIEVLQRIKGCGIVPAVRVNSEVQALRAVEALGEGGILIAEIAMSMPRSAQILKQATSRFGGKMLIGAGTVLNAKAAMACIQSGAQYIVSPSLHIPTIELCRQQGIATFAGALTPTEIETAWTAGADCVKVFPISAMGGIHYIKAIRAPFPQVELLPMGGVGLESVEDYLGAGCFALGVGNDLVSTSACEDKGGAGIAWRAAAYHARIEAVRKSQQRQDSEATSSGLLKMDKRAVRRQGNARYE
jgi:2-dehydro-3-deoxyphosphogluconate aldolase / (4S)-4-hydroxy-2-oxoglutarate aldolase